MRVMGPPLVGWRVALFPLRSLRSLSVQYAHPSQCLKTSSPKMLRLGPSKTGAPTEAPASVFSEVMGENARNIVY